MPVNRIAALLRLREPDPGPDPPDLADLTAHVIAAHGFCLHIVPRDSTSPTGVNGHSHGLRQTYGHPNFQVVAPIDPEAMTKLLVGLVALVQQGRRFEPGEVADDIIPGFSLAFATAEEGGREVLRVILPDPDGNVAAEEMRAEYRVQWEGCR